MNEEALINEIWGTADVRDAFDRFFIKGPAMPQPGEGPAPGTSPEELAAQAQEGEAERQHDLKKAKLKSRTDITKALLGHKADRKYQQNDHRLDARKKMIDMLMEALREMSAASERAQDRQIAASQPPRQPAAVQ
jgi:hypothetical protein